MVLVTAVVQVRSLAWELPCVIDMTKKLVHLEKKKEKGIFVALGLIQGDVPMQLFKFLITLKITPNW